MKLLSDTRFWVIIGVACLALFFWLASGLLMVGEPPAPMPLTYRILLLAVLLIAAGSLAFAIRLNAGRTNNAVLTEMGAMDEPANRATMLDEEEKQLRAKFGEATTFLKKQRFGNSGNKQHLYQLPWYVVFGSPGSGKTTAVRQSGLNFPLDEITNGNSLGGIGGTRNCDWWITDQAVLLDTAGRYTTQDSDTAHDARGWKNFLALLRKNRKRQPINGAVLVVGTDELLKMGDDEWQRYTQTVATRLRELVDELQMDFPVYLLLTKVDLLAGCREFFDGLDLDEQNQIWGITLPLNATVDALDPELEALNRRLHTQIPTKLRYERDTRRRQAIYSFPWQMENVTARLQGFVQDVFSRQGIGDHARFRGLYLTSAVQEGSPIERLFAGVTGSFGISGSLGGGERQSRSLFLKQLFPGVVFREAFLAGTNSAHDKRMRGLRVAAFAGIIAVAGGLAFAWSGAFTVHRNLLQEAEADLASFSNAPATAGQPLEQNLIALEHLQSAAGVFDQQDHPWLSGLGMYDSSVDEAAKGAYLRALQTAVAPALGGELLNWLKATSRTAYLDTFETLKAYLMLGDPAHREPEWLVGWLPVSPVPAIQQSTVANSQRHLEWLFEQDPDYALQPLDETTIERTRNRLNRIAASDAVYSRMRRLYEGETTDLLPRMGPYFTSVFETEDPDGLLMPTFFTAAGYETLDFGVDSDALRQWLGDRWVTGDDALPNPLQLADTANAVRPLYVRDYVATWQQFLGGIALIAPGDTEMLSDSLSYLSESALSPMSALANVVAEETTLPRQSELASAAASAAADAAGNALARKAGRAGSTARQLARSVDKPNLVDIPGEVASEFIEHHNMVAGGAASKDARIRSQIGDLRDWLYAVNNTPGQPAGPNPSNKLKLTARDIPGPYAGWVRQLAQSADRTANRKQAGRLNARWQRQVAGPCQRAFSSRFPFSTGADSDTTLRDFEDYFSPDGTEKTFVDQNLSRAMERDDGTLSTGTKWSIRQAERIREAFFPNGRDLGFTYRLTPIDVDDKIGEVVIESGQKQQVRYRHGPPVPLELRWPDGETGIRITFRRKDGSTQRRVIDGPWAIFRAVDAGRQSGGERYASVDSVLVTFTDGDYRATFRLTSDSRINPFQPGLLDKYRCRSGL